MAHDSSRSPFERLKERFERESLRCPECGHYEDDTAWAAETDGAQVRYRHECPSCGAEHVKTIDRD